MVVKAELHCHLEGTAHPELVVAQALKYGVKTEDYIDPNRGYIWKNFTSFFAAYDFAASLFRTPEDYVELTKDYYLRLAKGGAIYGEIFASPDHAKRLGCSHTIYIEAIAEGIQLAKERTGIEGRIIVVGVRHCGVDIVENAAKSAANNLHPMVTGFGMAGDERFGKVKDFAKAFDIARDAGLKLTTHAGEFCGPQSVEQSLNHLKVERIGHGVRSIEDLDLVKRLVDENITLEVCTMSNIALNVYPKLEDHPFKKLEQAGCKVTLNSDDPPHFHTSLKHEYEIAKKTFGYNDKALLGFTRNAIEAAFVDDETKKCLLAKC
ncbi:MAG: adenosine deaminase [Rhizobiales bacterium]|nr:adenosine deaminase [Hyphomicrobiales bacterium]